MHFTMDDYDEYDFEPALHRKRPHARPRRERDTARRRPASRRPDARRAWQDWDDEPADDAYDYMEFESYYDHSLNRRR